MNRRETREFISPLLQPPLNRLFVPRPTSDYLQPVDRDEGAKTWVMVNPTSSHIDLLGGEFTADVIFDDKESKSTRKEKTQAKRIAIDREIDAQIAQWGPMKNEQATEDAFKTIFVSRLPYDATEVSLKKEFERFGPIKTIKLIMNTVTGKPRGYAFIEYERERDMKVAYIEADGMRMEGSTRRLVVDIERGRTVKGWRPRRFSGGLGRTRVGGKDQNQKYSGRDPRASDILEQMVQSVGGRTDRKRSLSPIRHRDGRDGRHDSRHVNGGRYDDRRRR